MQAQEHFYTKPKKPADVSPPLQITRVGMSHSPCGTSKCFFSLAVVAGFPNLDFLGAGSGSVQLRSVPLCSGSPWAAEQLRGRDAVMLALGTGESRSSGVQGSEF